MRKPKPAPKSRKPAPTSVAMSALREPVGALLIALRQNCNIRRTPPIVEVTSNPAAIIAATNAFEEAMRGLKVIA